MKKYLLAVLLSCVSAVAACEDSAEPEDQPITLAATMKLAADSLNVSLRVTNVSDTTQVLEWFEDCPGGHPTDFAVYRDAGLTQQVWKTPSVAACPAVEAELILGPNQAGTIRGYGTAVPRILGDSIATGRYYVAAHPHGLRVRPLGASYDRPISAKVGIGPVDLTRTPN
jgi:hypothetical protein